MAERHEEQRISHENEYYVKLHSELSKAESELCSKRLPKRQDYIPWEEFYMSVAFLSSKRSKDPNTQVGACIVNPQSKKIVGIGHNALPESHDWDQTNFPYWQNCDVSNCGLNKTKYAYVCHASINAILNKNAESLEGCVLYTTLFPGHEDAKIIIQAGITEVIYYEDKYPDHEFTFIAKKLFDKAGVDYKRDPNRETSTSFVHNIREIIMPGGPIRGNLKDSETADFTLHPPPLSDRDFFMCLACLAARRSKDPKRQVGACIVNKDNKIVGIGYNGFPRHVSDDDSDMNWSAESDLPRHSKLSYVVHAEVNAIMYKTCVDLKGCTIYTTLFPCNECAKVIIQCGIERIYYLMDNKERLYMKASRELLQMAKYRIIENYTVNPSDNEKICQRCVIPNLEMDRDPRPGRVWVAIGLVHLIAGIVSSVYVSLPLGVSLIAISVGTLYYKYK